MDPLQLTDLEVKLETEMKELEAKEKELEAKEKELAAKEKKLETEKKELEAKEKELKAKDKELADNKKELVEKSAPTDGNEWMLLVAQQNTLAAQQNTLAAQQKTLAARWNGKKGPFLPSIIIIINARYPDLITLPFTWHVQTSLPRKRCRGGRSPLLLVPQVYPPT